MRRKNKILQLQLRISPEDKAAIIRHAKKANMGISEWVLNKALPPAEQAFGELVLKLKSDPNPKYVLAEIHDLLNSATADEFELMVARIPQVLLSSYLANYLAAMVEYAAAKKGKKPPRWTEEIPALTKPVFSSDLQNLRLYLLTHSPPPFRCRNIFIDSSIGERV